MKQNKKIVLIACDSSRSLIDFRGKLIEELLVNNEVHVFTPQITQLSIRNKLTTLGVHVHENNLYASNVSISSDLRYIYDLHRTIRLIKPDVFFPYAFKPVIYGSILARFNGVNRISPMLTGLGYNFLDSSSRKGLVKKITKGLLKYALRNGKSLRVILQNKDDYQTLLNTGILSKKHQAFVVNGSGVDMTHYEFSQPDSRKISFLMIARLINAKGIREFYEAACIIRRKHPEARFKLVGPYEDNIDVISPELYEKIRSGEVIEYLGLTEDVRPHIKDSSVVVLPSYYGEGVPRCILEAMAMGRAVITSDSVGCRETVDVAGERNGFLIPVKNAEALAEKMEHYISTPEDIIVHGLNGRRYAEEKFHVKKVNQQMLHILEAS